MQTFPEIYKFDSKGNARVWYMVLDGNRYYTVSGLIGGKLAESKPKLAFATNVGRSNERDAFQQARFEIEAAYEKKLTREYHRSLDEARGGAHFFQPMLAKGFAMKLFKPGFAQPKLDGFRCIAQKSGLTTRQGKPITSCRHIERALKPIFDAHPEAVLDGELYNHALRDDFNELSSLIRKTEDKLTDERRAQVEAQVQFHVYDLPSNQHCFSQRHHALTQMFNLVTHDSIIIPVETVWVTTLAAYDEQHGIWIEEGYEGSMWRDDTEYEGGKRSAGLRKRKDFDDAEFDVVRIDEGQGNWEGYAKRVWCWLPGADRSNGPDWEKKTNIFAAGTRGSQERQKQILAEKDEHKVVTVRFFGWTPSDIPKPRFGVVTSYHGAAREL